MGETTTIRRFTWKERISGWMRPTLPNATGYLDKRTNFWKQRQEARADCRICEWKGPWREFRWPYEKYFAPIAAEIDSHWAKNHTPIMAEDTRSAPTVAAE